MRVTFYPNAEEAPAEQEIETPSAIFTDIQDTNSRKSWLRWKWT